MRITVCVLLCCVLVTACSETTDPDPIPISTITSFTFLDGSWDIVSTYHNPDGSMDQSSAEASVRSSYQGGVRKEQWVGTRNGEPAEVATMFVASENNGRWIVARGDGNAGTFDVLEGSFSNGIGTFTSRSGTRPDGGMTRETFSEIEEDSFRWQAERSDDGGQSWTVYWTMEYTRDPAGGVLASPGVAPGCETDEHGQFEFWAGDWNVGGATNDLRSVLAGCILEENWSSSSEDGTSFNMYDVRSGLWNQVWRDTNEFTLVIYGGLEGDRMVMDGPRLGAQQRITWTPNADGTVRQHGESSSDNGQTWTTSYDLTYVRR